MLRTILMAVLAALLLVPAAAHAAGPVEILRDCQDDDVLQGDYTLSELREAQRELPTDIDEYSPCRDVLERAIEAKTSSSPTSSNDDGTGPSNPTGGTSTGGGGPTGGSSGGSSPIVGNDSGREQPANEQELKALESSATYVDTGGESRAVSPGATRLAADVGRNGMPTTMIAVLALLAAAAVSLAAPPLVRRGLARRKP